MGSVFASRCAALRVGRRLLFGSALGLLAGCHGQVTAPTAAGTVTPPHEAPPPPRVAPPPHAGGQRLRDGRTGAPLDEAQLRERLHSAQAVYVGEQHDSAASHRAQLYVLEQLHAIDPQAAVGLEMLPRPLQPQLDAFLTGAVDEDGFLKAVDWPRIWGFDYALYRPIFEFCRAHGLRMYALNAPRDLARAVRQRGIEGLSESERAQLPSGHPWPQPEPQRRVLYEVFAQHAFAGKGDAKKSPAAEAAFARFYLAQLVWDESMAAGVAELLREDRPGAPRHLLLLAGTGHVGPHAVPGRAARRGVKSALTLGPVEGEDEAPPTDAGAVDVLLVLEKEKKQ